MNRLGSSLNPGQVKAQDYVAIYYAGGHGVIWDFLENTGLQELTRRIFEAGGVVASICHGAVGLLNIKLSDNTLLVKDREVTGFSNTEEKLVELDKVVPFLTETELKARGGLYRKGEEPWQAFAIADQKESRLITGQNPASGVAVAELVLKALSERKQP
ncbi:chaperone protein HchA [compost metagenome]